MNPVSTMRAWAVSLLACGCSVSLPDPGGPLTLPTSNPSVLRAVLVGDVGRTGAHHERVARSVVTVCAERGCDLILFPGDNLYPRGVQEGEASLLEQILAPYGEAGVPLVLVLGNHDWGHGFDEAAALRQLAVAAEHENWVMPSFDYEVTAGPATLLAVETTRAFWDGPRGRDRWVHERLTASQRRWRVVLGHHTLRSDGPHGDVGHYEGWAGVPYMSGNRVARMLEESVCDHADLYLSGHDHSRQWLTDCGTQFLVSGAGSSVTELVRDRAIRQWGSASLGSIWFELGAELTVAFYDDHARLEQEFRAPGPSR